MAFRIDENGNITMVQGDTGILALNGLNTDMNYIVYFAVQDEDRRPVGNELRVESNFQPIVVFSLTTELTDLFKVTEDEETQTYYYGIKICTEEGYEDTVTIGNLDMSYKNTITVYPKKVEGI